MVFRMPRPFDPTRERLNRTPMNDRRLLSGPYWAELRIFLAVAKSKSYNRAAETLNISQPTVSRLVHRLQDMIGSQLLTSSSKGIVLTDKGKELAEALIALDERLSSISQKLSAESKETASLVRFSSTEAIAGLFVIPAISDFSLRHPKISIHVRNITNMSDFRENQSDIVLGFAPSEQRGVESRPVGYMHLITYASKDYILRQGMPSHSDLENHRFIDAEYYSSKTEIWKPWRDVLARGSVAHLCDNSFAYCMMVKEGLGIGLLGNYVLPDPELVAVNIGIHVELPMYLLAETERLQSRPVKIVYDWLSGVLSPETSWLSSDLTISSESRPLFGRRLARILFDDWSREPPV
jgi:DNA-binding transcriptional LysR family regulator